MAAKGKVFVTGGSGFIGRAAVRALVAGGLAVTAPARSRGARATLQGLGAQTPQIDLTDRDKMAAAMSGADCVVHLAYDIRSDAAANLSLFDAWHAAASDAGVGHFVHLSSIVVYDGWPDEDIDETSPVTDPADGSYRAAKVAMEDRVLSGALPGYCLQPTLVYGPGSPLWTTQFLDVLARQNLTLPEPEGLCHAVHVRDVAGAILAACQRKPTKPKRLIISGREPLRWSDLMAGYAEIAGSGSIVRMDRTEMRRKVGRPTRPVVTKPSIPARASAALRRLIGHRATDALSHTARGLRPAKGDWLPSPQLLDLFLASGNVSIAAAQKEIGFAPSVDLPEALAEIAASRRKP